MRVLFLCHRVPFPADKGDKIRAFHDLTALARVHDIDLFTLADDPADLEHRKALEPYCRRITIGRVIPKLARLRSLPYLASRTPLTLPYFYSRWLDAQIRTAAEQTPYDRVFIYCSAMAQYVLGNRSSSRVVKTSDPFARVPVVTDLVDIDSDKWSQYAEHRTFPFSTVYRKEGRDLRAYERHVCESSSCAILATEREAELARIVAPTARIHTVGNGVDTEYFSPSGAGARPYPPSVIFTGDMGYYPNQEAAIFFAREILPLARRHIPDLRFLVVGRNPDGRVEALGRIAGVEVTGFVPDVRPWLARAMVSVAPLTIAAGVQNKILEAMASGLPVVATPRAVRGLTPGVAEAVETAENAEAFAAKVVHLIDNPTSAASRGLSGRNRVGADYSWDRSHQRLLRLIEDPLCSDLDGVIGDQWSGGKLPSRRISALGG